MTSLEKQLANALNRLAFSANHYIEDGSWIEVLNDDIQNAKAMIQQYKTAKKAQSQPMEV